MGEADIMQVGDEKQFLNKDYGPCYLTSTLQAHSPQLPKEAGRQPGVCPCWLLMACLFFPPKAYAGFLAASSHLAFSKEPTSWRGAAILPPPP